MTATSPYLNRPPRSEEQAKADKARLQANLRAVHMLNATQASRTPFEPIQDDAMTAGATIGAILACLFLIVCIGVGVGLLTGILDL